MQQLQAFVDHIGGRLTYRQTLAGTYNHIAYDISDLHNFQIYAFVQTQNSSYFLKLSGRPCGLAWQHVHHILLCRGQMKQFLIVSIIIFHITECFSQAVVSNSC